MPGMYAGFFFDWILNRHVTIMDFSASLADREYAMLRPFGEWPEIL